MMRMYKRWYCDINTPTLESGNGYLGEFYKVTSSRSRYEDQNGVKYNSSYTNLHRVDDGRGHSIRHDADSSSGDEVKIEFQIPVEVIRRPPMQLQRRSSQSSLYEESSSSYSNSHRTSDRTHSRTSDKTSSRTQYDDYSSESSRHSFNSSESKYYDARSNSESYTSSSTKSYTKSSTKSTSSYMPPKTLDGISSWRDNDWVVFDGNRWIRFHNVKSS